jgi:hypothetical protein
MSTRNASVLDDAVLLAEDFRSYFENFGTITDVVVMYDHQTQRPRGFGFISFDQESSVETVMEKSFHELNGKTVRSYSLFSPVIIAKFLKSWATVWYAWQLCGRQNTPQLVGKTRLLKWRVVSLSFVSAMSQMHFRQQGWMDPNEQVPPGSVGPECPSAASHSICFQILHLLC